MLVCDSAIEVTVRSRVFAPHTRGLQYITVQGFVMEYAANNWCANMWFPDKAHWPYAQSGVLGTRSGYKWTIHNNTLRYGKTIGLDIGIEGGYVPACCEDHQPSSPSPHNFCPSIIVCTIHLAGCHILRCHKLQDVTFLRVSSFAVRVSHFAG